MESMTGNQGYGLRRARGGRGTWWTRVNTVPWQWQVNGQRSGSVADQDSIWR